MYQSHDGGTGGGVNGKMKSVEYVIGNRNQQLAGQDARNQK